MLRCLPLSTPLPIACLLAALVATTAPVAAQDKRPPPSRAAAHYSFAPVVKKAAPAVVNVFVRRRAAAPTSPLAGTPFANDPFFRRFFGEQLGLPQERMENSLGSGVIVSPTGIVVTNTHVIKGAAAADIRLVLADRRELDARVLSQDEKTDIAVLRIEGDGRFPHIEFEDSDKAEVGDLVLAIGNPFGVGQTVTSGIVSASTRTEVGTSDGQVYIQTDAAINPGNSGGALVDMAGRLIGINTAIYSRSGGSHGIGFAIPANLVRLHVEAAAAGRRIERPWLGAKLNPLTRDLADGFSLDRVAGALVAEVEPGSAASAAGLTAGDVILAVDGHDVVDPRAVMFRLATKGVGNTARLDVLRKGQRMAIELAIAAAPRLGPDDERVLMGPHPLDGARVANLKAHLADEFGLADREGVVIVETKVGAPAAMNGLKRGDIIVGIGRERTATIAALEEALRQKQRPWLLAIKRGGRVFQLRAPG